MGRKKATTLSLRIKYAMAHLSRKQHLSLLARPNWRKIQRMDANHLSNPFTTRRAALRSRASNRIRMLARPKYVNRKYDPTMQPPSYEPIHPKTLEATASKRIEDLAIPKKRVLMWTMRFAPNQEISEYLAEQLWQFENSRYQRYRVFCNARLEREARRRQRAIAKLRKSLSTPEDWDRHMEVLKRLAVPKVAPRPKGPERRRKWRPINVQRLEELAQPVPREEPEVRDPFVVPESALNYEISRRIMEIAFPKHTPDIVPPRIPGAVSRAALKAVASPRTIILAKPAERPAGMETDLREDAFTVSPAALKARCTKRIKMLARPKTYGR